MFMPVVKGSNTREVAGGIHELAEDLADSAFHNRDMAPTTRAPRKWVMKDIAALWISMSACIPTYTLASSLIDEGMNWWQAVLTIFLGNAIVLVPMVLNAHAGTKYGIPFPVYCRSSFGILGANIPALLRALVACGWFGIQTWIGGAAIYMILAVYRPQWRETPKETLSVLGASTVGLLAAPQGQGPFLAASALIPVRTPTELFGLTFPQLACFLLFWAINMF